MFMKGKTIPCIKGTMFNVSFVIKQLLEGITSNFALLQFTRERNHATVTFVTKFFIKRKIKYTY